VIIEKRGLGSAASAANAIVDHVHDWLLGSDGRMVSMSVYTDGSAYGVEAGLIYSLPVICKRGGAYEIVKGLTIDAFSQEKFNATETELKEERAVALA
ncbi:malate dehydrogenase, partial [archaeon]